MTIVRHFVVRAGDTYRIRKPQEETEHLWVVATNPDPDGQVAMVNFTTRRSHSDATVVLKAGEHPFVIHDTAVNYQDARRTASRSLIQACMQGAISKHEPCDSLVLKKIQRGFAKSPRTPADIMRYVSGRLHTNYR